MRCVDFAVEFLYIAPVITSYITNLSFLYFLLFCFYVDTCIHEYREEHN